MVAYEPSDDPRSPGMTITLATPSWDGSGDFDGLDDADLSFN